MDLCKNDNLSTLRSVSTVFCEHCVQIVLMSSTSLSLYKIGLFLTSSCLMPEAL